MLLDLIPLVENGSNYICITRPRRFGKTVMANMIAAYFGKGADGHAVFDHLDIAKSGKYKQHLNQYDVIHISFNQLDSEPSTYNEYISYIKNLLHEDLLEIYPELASLSPGELLADLRIIYARTGRQFLFVLDEWDYIFNQEFVTEQDKKSFLSFLRNLLKDKPYVRFAYMTGILPIAKYSSGSELNMVTEFTMAKSPAFSDYFGFTESEVDSLYEKYVTVCPNPRVTREGLRIWYDGYHTAVGERIYNPWFVVLSLQYNNLES